MKTNSKGWEGISNEKNSSGKFFKQKWEQACANIMKWQKENVPLRNINTTRLAAVEKAKGRVAKIESGVQGPHHEEP